MWPSHSPLPNFFLMFPFSYPISAYFIFLRFWSMPEKLVPKNSHLFDKWFPCLLGFAAELLVESWAQTSHSPERTPLNTHLHDWPSLVIYVSSPALNFLLSTITTSHYIAFMFGYICVFILLERSFLRISLHLLTDISPLLRSMPSKYLRSQTFIAKGSGSIPGQETRSNKPSGIAKKTKQTNKKIVKM